MVEPITAEERLTLALGVRHPKPRTAKRTELLNGHLGLLRQHVLHLGPALHDALDIRLREQLLATGGRLRRLGQRRSQVTLIDEIGVGRRPELIQQEVKGRLEGFLGIVLLDVEHGTHGRNRLAVHEEILWHGVVGQADARRGPLAVVGEILGLGGQCPRWFVTCSAVERSMQFSWSAGIVVIRTAQVVHAAKEDGVKPTLSARRRMKQVGQLTLLGRHWLPGSSCYSASPERRCK